MFFKNVGNKIYIQCGVIKKGNSKLYLNIKKIEECVNMKGYCLGKPMYRSFFSARNLSVIIKIQYLS